MNRNEVHDELIARDEFEYDDRIVYQIFKSIGVLTLVSAPFVMYFTPGLHVMYRLWIAFLLVNILVWGVALVVACGRAMFRGALASRRMLARWQRARREHVGAARLALE